MEYKEGPQSTVTHGKHEYLVDDLIEIDRPVKSIKVSSLDWVLKYTTTHEDRIEKADLSIPVIVLDVGGKYGLVVLDGAHRLAKAVSEGKKEIMAKVIRESDLPKPIK